MTYSDRHLAVLHALGGVVGANLAGACETTIFKRPGHAMQVVADLEEKDGDPICSALTAIGGPAVELVLKMACSPGFKPEFARVALAGIFALHPRLFFDTGAASKDEVDAVNRFRKVAKEHSNQILGWALRQMADSLVQLVNEATPGALDAIADRLAVDGRFSFDTAGGLREMLRGRHVH